MKPLPNPTPETQTFWDKARDRELWLPKCNDTARFFFPPRPYSPFTGGEVVWERASGKATLASFVILNRPSPGYEGEGPYIIALADLAEGVRMMTNLPGAPVDPSALAIGAKLSVVFEERGDMIIPQFALENAG